MPALIVLTTLALTLCGLQLGYVITLGAIGVGLMAADLVRGH
jgi:hypothetical protein